MTSRITALGWFVLGLSVVAGLLFLLVFPRLEGTPPEISTASELAVGVPGRDLTVELHDSGSGLRSVELRLLHPAGTRKILERQFPGGWFRTGIQHPEPVELRLDPRELSVPDGSATLVISARDWSLRHGVQANRAEVQIPLTAAQNFHYAFLGITAHLGVALQFPLNPEVFVGFQKDLNVVTVAHASGTVAQQSLYNNILARLNVFTLTRHAVHVIINGLEDRLALTQELDVLFGDV